MDRRKFLKGTFGGVAAGGIVIAAGVPDTQAFVEQVKLGDPVAATIPPTGEVANGEILFNSSGIAVAVVTEVQYHRPAMDVSSIGDSFRRFELGALDRVDIHAVGILGPPALSRNWTELGRIR